MKISLFGDVPEYRTYRCRNDRLKSALSSIVFPPISADNTTIYQSARFGDVILEANARLQ
jgi:hypothetical protein